MTNNGIPVILCVGSDKIPGDSIGPLVGDYLKTSFRTRCFVYGATNASVNGTNIGRYLDVLAAAHEGNPVIAVDACLSAGSFPRDVLVRAGGVNPKRALTDAYASAGDVGILGVISDEDSNPLTALMTASIDKVEKIAFKIAYVIYSALLPTVN